MWCDYTDEEVFILKNALSGSLSAGISEGVFSQYDSFVEKFVDFSTRATGEENFYRENTRFPQTSRIYDIIGKLVRFDLDKIRVVYLMVIWVYNLCILYTTCLHVMSAIKGV